MGNFKLVHTCPEGANLQVSRQSQPSTPNQSVNPPQEESDDDTIIIRYPSFFTNLWSNFKDTSLVVIFCAFIITFLSVCDMIVIMMESLFYVNIFRPELTNVYGKQHIYLITEQPFIPYSTLVILAIVQAIILLWMMDVIKFESG